MQRMVDIYSIKEVLKGKSNKSVPKNLFEGPNILVIGSARAKEFSKYIFSSR